MVFLTFRASFNAIHRLWNPALSEAENNRLFGECANPSGHGHLYKVEVTVRGNATPDRPVAIGRGAVDRIIRDVLAPVLQDANLDVVFGFGDFISTGENVTREIWKRLEPALAEIAPEARLARVRVIETRKNSFAYYGEEDCNVLLCGL